MRYPAISPNGQTIAFTYKGNIYTVSVNGGEARQVTFHKAHDYKAVWSRDGQYIAFASDRYGNFDLFIIPALGGEARRLTYHSNDEVPYTFSPDDQQIVFGGVRQDAASHRQYPTRSQPELYQVPRKGGRVSQVLTVPAEDVQYNPEGNIMLYHDKKGGENEFRKHHKSSIARDIWKYDPRIGEHTMLTRFEGEDRNPVFSSNGNRMFYLSEESGSFNVHEMDLESPGSSKQVTQFNTHPVRYLSMAGELMAFSFDGQLYTMQVGGEPRKVELTVRTDFAENTERVVSISDGVTEMQVSPNGKEIAFIARGEVFVTAVDNGLTKRITSTPEQERFLRFTHDGKALTYARETNGKWIIYQTRKKQSGEPYFFASTLLEETEFISGEKDNYLVRFSPDGSRVAWIEDRRILKVRELKSGNNVTLLTPEELFHMRDGDQYFAWSPDSKWLAVGWDKTLSNQEVLLISRDGKIRKNLTQSGYRDYRPQWTGKGEQLLWFSNRNGLKSYATSGRTESDVYAMFLTQKAWDKYRLSKEEFELLEMLDKEEKKSEDDNKKKDKKETESEISDVVMDWNGLTERKARLTIHSSRLGDAVLSGDGEKLYYLAAFEKGYDLWETELRSRKTQKIIALGSRSASIQWDAKNENLYILGDGKMMKADLKARQAKPVALKSEMMLDQEAERRHMFDHIVLRTENIFYTSDFHGQNWDALRKAYAKYLPHIGNSYEFAEMISELLGELNVSHAGARYSGSITNGDATASLGVLMDYDHRGPGIRIAEVLEDGPLDKAGFDLEPGDVIRAVNDTPIDEDRDVAAYLNRLEGQFVLLDIRKKGKADKQLTVKPIGLNDENRLLYKRWVKKNEEEVERRSHGKLGYVHIPGMSDEPYRNIYEKMLGKYEDKEAVIIDARFNGGGDLVADLAMFFTGEPFISYETETRKVGGEPTSRWTKPTLAMFNEAMYSDGHCFASGYTDLAIGKTVGMPVPGTCSFAGWESLPDGGRWGVVPVSARNKAGEWMENNQTEPQILVKNDPRIIARGRDQQLELSVDELLKDIK